MGKHRQNHQRMRTATHCHLQTSRVRRKTIKDSRRSRQKMPMAIRCRLRAARPAVQQLLHKDKRSQVVPILCRAPHKPDLKSWLMRGSTLYNRTLALFIRLIQDRKSVFINIYCLNYIQWCSQLLHGTEHAAHDDLLITRSFRTCYLFTGSSIQWNQDYCPLNSSHKFTRSFTACKRDRSRFPF